MLIKALLCDLGFVCVCVCVYDLFKAKGSIYFGGVCNLFKLHLN